MIKAFALTGRIAKCYLIPRVLPWAKSCCPLPFPSAGDRWFRACCCIETFGDVCITFGDNLLIFGDIIPYQDFEARQPVRRSYQPRTY